MYFIYNFKSDRTFILRAMNIDTLWKQKKEGVVKYSETSLII